MGEKKRRDAAAETWKTVAGDVVDRLWNGLEPLAGALNLPRAAILALLLEKALLGGGLAPAAADHLIGLLERVSDSLDQPDEPTPSAPPSAPLGGPPPPWRDIPPQSRLGDAPIEAGYRETMNALARELDARFNGKARGGDRKTGFILLAFPFGDNAEGRCNFISNGAARADIVTLFREMIARFEGQPEASGRA